MIQRVSIWTLCLLAAALFLNACGAKQYPVPDEPVQDARALMAHVQERDQSIDAARARAVMAYFGSEGRVRVRQDLQVSLPGNIKLENLLHMTSKLLVGIIKDT